MAEEATITSAGDNRACSDRRSGENKHGSGERAGGRTGYGVPLRRDPYAMEVDRGRNCYTCRGFGYMARNCRNRGQRGRVAENRRVEYGGGRIEEIMNITNNLKGDENLELLN